MSCSQEFRKCSTVPLSINSTLKTHAKVPLGVEQTITTEGQILITSALYRSDDSSKSLCLVYFREDIHVEHIKAQCFTLFGLAMTVTTNREKYSRQSLRFCSHQLEGVHMHRRSCGRLLVGELCKCCDSFPFSIIEITFEIIN